MDSCLDRINARHDSPLAEDLLEAVSATGGRVIGKSNGRSNRSGDSSWLWPTWSYPDDLYVFCSDLDLDRPLTGLSGGTQCVQAVPVLDKIVHLPRRLLPNG